MNVFQALSSLDSVSLMYPFFYRPMFEVIEDGWNTFRPEDAFKDLETMVRPKKYIIRVYELRNLP